VSEPQPTMRLTFIYGHETWCDGRHIPKRADGRECDATLDRAEAPALDVERLAQIRDVVQDWLDAERLLDTMTADDGPALQDAWDAVHFTRERCTREYVKAQAGRTE